MIKESQSSAFWFQPDCDLCACAQPKLQSSSWVFPVEELKDTYQLYRYTTCSFNAFPLFLHSLTFLISNYLILPFGTQRRPTNKKLGTKKGFCTQESLTGSCMISLSLFCPLMLIKISHFQKVGFKNIHFSLIFICLLIYLLQSYFNL